MLCPIKSRDSTMAATAVFQEHVGRDMQRYSESGQRMVCICVPVYDSRVVLIQRYENRFVLRRFC